MEICVLRNGCLEMNKCWCTLSMLSDRAVFGTLQNLTHLQRNPQVQVDLASLDRAL